jgi:hypothetical protein
LNKPFEETPFPVHIPPKLDTSNWINIESKHIVSIGLMFASSDSKTLIIIELEPVQPDCVIS